MPNGDALQHLFAERIIANVSIESLYRFSSKLEVQALCTPHASGYRPLLSTVGAWHKMLAVFRISLVGTLTLLYPMLLRSTRTVRQELRYHPSIH